MVSYGVITGRNKVVAMVMFLLVSVILLTGGGSASVHARIPPSRPPRADPPGVDPPEEQTPPLGAGTLPGSRLRHTVNERLVRILLECILVQ